MDAAFVRGGSSTMERHAAFSKNRILEWVGYGSFMCMFCGGMGILHMGPLLQRWDYVLFSQLANLAGLSVGLLSTRAFARHQRAQIPPLPAGFAYTLVCSLLLMMTSMLAQPGLNPVLACVICAVIGFFASQPMLFWYDRLLGAYRHGGRALTVALLALAELVPVAASLAVQFLSNLTDQAPLIMCTLSVISCLVCQILIARPDRQPQPAQDHPEVASSETYRLAPYSIGMLVCLGVTWGTSCSMSILTNASSAAEVSFFYQAFLIALTVALVAYLIRGVSSGNMRFGNLIRLSIVASSVIVAFAPILHGALSYLYLPFCEVVFVLEEVAIALFSIEVCRESNLRMHVVLPLNFAVFAAAACLAGIVFWVALTFCSEKIGWELVAALVATVVLCIVPFLPTRSGSAQTFTLDELPEDESYDARIARRRANMTTKYGLAKRESEVLELLLQGKTRQQIADMLALSPWTIKDRIGDIYKKMGVHSYKELVKLVSDDEE